jgi:hypothetical protein
MPQIDAFRFSNFLLKPRARRVRRRQCVRIVRLLRSTSDVETVSMLGDPKTSSFSIAIIRGGL